MKICTMSDLHGYLPSIEPCDLVLICGDSINLYCQGSSNATRKWYKYKFKPWATSLQCDKVLFIAGNHELQFPNNYALYKNMFPNHEKVTYLMHEEYEYKGLKIFGTPYCKIFGNWAFMETDDVLDKLYQDIPKNLDILLTHDAPFGYSDILLQEDCFWATGEHIGNKPLAKAILKRNISWIFHGHLHSSSKEWEPIGNGKIINCSIKDEGYNPIYDPITIEI